MKARLARTISILAIIIIWLLLIASPVLAAIASPEELQINAVYVYQHCLENNDQLYIVEYYIDYDPDLDPLTDDNPDENINEAYLLRLMDGVVELKAVAPYSYYDEGYDEGVIAIYFSATDPNLPTWEDSYTMQLTGNPTLDWSGDPPSTSTSSFDLWSSSTGIIETQSELTARILWLADQLEQTWGVNMVDTTNTGSYLSSYGTDYFTNVIPNVKAMAPQAFFGSTTSPDWEYRETVTTYADDRADSIEGTPLDLQPLADWWGISRMWTSSLLFMLGGIFLLYAMLSPTGSYRGFVFLSTPLIIAGGYLGMIPLLATVLMGFAAFALSIFTLFYHPSGV